MTRTSRYTFAAVEAFPRPLEPGVVYVSTKFSTAGHICPCGCGREVITKLSPARYRIIFDGEVSLAPSVASTGMPCNSHYFITRGEVDWHQQLDVRHTDRARAADQRAVEPVRRTSRLGPAALESNPGLTSSWTTPRWLRMSL